MTKLTVDVGGCHVLIEDPDGRTIRVPVADLDQLAEQIAGIEPVAFGARRRDCEGDIWTLSGGKWWFLGGAPKTWSELNATFGPLYPVKTPE